MKFVILAILVVTAIDLIKLSTNIIAKHSLLVGTSRENVGWIPLLLFIQLNQNDFSMFNEILVEISHFFQNCSLL